MMSQWPNSTKDEEGGKMVASWENDGTRMRMRHVRLWSTALCAAFLIFGKKNQL